MKHSAFPFEDALDDLRISGAVLLHERYAPPWAIDIPQERCLRVALGVTEEVRAFPFHLVRAGAFDLSPDGGEPVRIETNEVAICPSGAAHRMSFGQGATAISLARVLVSRETEKAGNLASATELLCGVFLLRDTPLNPLLAALPPVLKIDTSGAHGNPSLKHAVQMLAIEADSGRSSGFTAARLLEIFCAEAIGAYRRGAGVQHSGWFKALEDPKVGQAIRRLHESPGAPWSVASLAATVAMSPSRFAARFRAVMGQSVMSYVAAWRMNVACRRLRETKANLTSVAIEVGYNDVAAFSRAFKALVGHSPSAWRAAKNGLTSRAFSDPIGSENALDRPE